LPHLPPAPDHQALTRLLRRLRALRLTILLRLSAAVRGHSMQTEEESVQSVLCGKGGGVGGFVLGVFGDRISSVGREERKHGRPGRDRSFGG
ncbi:MAG: hypothetical protein M1830_006943, partial [Pleopsidium flavum]